MGGAVVRRQRVQAEVARIKAVQVARAATSQCQDPSEYCLSFGSHSGCTITEVMRKAPRYFAALVQQTQRDQEPLGNIPGLKEQLILAGLWDDILSEGLAMRKAKTRMTKKVEESGAAIGYHPEVRALHNIYLRRDRKSANAERCLPELDVVVHEPPVPRSKRSRATPSKARSTIRKPFNADQSWYSIALDKIGR